MSRTQKLLYNSIAAAIYSIASVIVGLILPRLVIAAYGSDINGLTVSIKQFVSYLTYLEAGLGASFIYALYRPLAQDEQTNVNNLVSQANKAYIKTSAMYLAGTIILAAAYPAVIQRGEASYSMVSILVAAIGISGALDIYTLSKFRVLLVSDQKAYIVNYMSLIALIVNFGLSIILICIKANIILVNLIPLASLMVRTAVLNNYIKKHYPYIDYKGKTDTLVLDKRYDAMLMEVSKTINLSLPIVTISLFGSLQTVSVYSVYNLVFSGLKSILHVITNGVTASFGNIIAKDEKKTLQKANEEFEVFLYAALTFLYSCTLILIIPFIRLYVKGISDSNVYIDFSYGVLFVLWDFLHNARLPHTSLIAAAGMYRAARTANISQVILMVVLLFGLVPKYQIRGALIAMAVSALYKTIKMIFIVKKEIIYNSVWVTGFRIIRGLITIVICYIPFALCIRIESVTLFQWIIAAMPVGVWCLFVTVCINLIFDRFFFVAAIKHLMRLTYINIKVNI